MRISVVIYFFLQLVNFDTVAVGCGFHICPEFEYYGVTLPFAAMFVCNYGPQWVEPRTLFNLQTSKSA